MPVPDEEFHRLVKRMEHIERLLGDEPTDRMALARSIEKFGVSAERLSKALHDVDHSQRELVMLKTSKADVADVEAIDERHSNDLRKMRSIMISAAVLACTFALATVYAFWMYARATDAANVQYADATVEICKQRSEQSRIVRNYLELSAARAASNPSYTEEQREEARTQARTLASAFPEIDCSQFER